MPLNYKYDVSFMIDDLMDLLDRLLAEESGHMRIEWPSTTFFAKWEVGWTPEQVQIESQWESVRDYLLEPLNQSGPVRVGKKAFSAEWSRLLEIVMESLKSSGYRTEVLPGMTELQNLLSSSQGRGYLYEGPP